MKEQLKLPVKNLKAKCNPQSLPFKSTLEVKPLEGPLGQKRAMEALATGLQVKSMGYNVFMAGIPGTLRVTLARLGATAQAQKEETPFDWVYVHNFILPEAPRALAFPPGQGAHFKAAMENLVKKLEYTIPLILGSQEVLEGKTRLFRRFKKESAKLLEGIEALAAKEGFRLHRDEEGLVLVPLGRELGRGTLEDLSPIEVEKIREKSRALEEKMMLALHEKQDLERRLWHEITNLEKDQVIRVLEASLAELKEKYKAEPMIVEYLREVQQDIAENYQDFQSLEEKDAEELFWASNLKKNWVKYQVNLLVDRQKTIGAPVVVELNPTFHNLFGRVEYKQHFGQLQTDFTMLRSGALHQANGGYLILKAREVLSSPLVWETLKRVLKSGNIGFEYPEESGVWLPVNTLKAERIPLSLKVILIGSPYLYHLLSSFDEDFSQLFKVLAELDNQIPRNQRNILIYSGWLSALCNEEELLPLNKLAVAGIVEHSSRLCHNQTKLTTRLGELKDLVREADALAQGSGAAQIDIQHIRKAVYNRNQRQSKYEELFLEQLRKEKLLFSTQGQVIGQVNGLVVHRLSNYSFGKPIKITAQAFTGNQGVINIERESRLSGRLHDKGLLIIAGYLGGKYAYDKNLSLSASVCFEQHYDPLDGDSASSAELYAIISSLAQLPIHQELAVTGSVNQKGEIQPIGMVNEKIEGFFAACRAQGLTGKQGVIIPKQNIEDLMLSDEVVVMVEEGNFSIYAVSTIDEGIELLMGVPAGLREANSFTKDSVHHRVDRRLRELVQGLNTGKRGFEEA